MMNKTKAEAAPAKVAQHTPGPWNLAPDGVVWDLLGGGNWIATIHNGYDEDESNARLIAAAPELLEALKECITEDGAAAWKSAKNAGQRLEAISNIARAAIAKAEGKL